MSVRTRPAARARPAPRPWTGGCLPGLGGSGPPPLSISTWPTTTARRTAARRSTSAGTPARASLRAVLSLMAQAQAGIALPAVAPTPLRFPSGSRWRGPRCIPACSVSQAPAGAQPGSRCARSGQPESFPRLRATPSGHFTALFLCRWKTSSPPGPPGCPPALLRLPSFPAPEHTTTRTPPPGTTSEKKARHGHHHDLPLSSHHLREARLRRPDHSGGVRLHSTAAARSAPAARARSPRGWTTSSPRSNRRPRCSPGAPRRPAGRLEPPCRAVAAAAMDDIEPPF